MDGVGIHFDEEKTMEIVLTPEEHEEQSLAVRKLIDDARARAAEAQRVCELAEERKRLARQAKIQFAFERVLPRITPLVPAALLPYMRPAGCPSDLDLEEEWLPEYFKIQGAPGLMTIAFQVRGEAASYFEVLDRFEEPDYNKYPNFDAAILRAAQLYEMHVEFEAKNKPTKSAPLPQPKTKTPAEQLWELFGDALRDAVSEYFAAASDAEASWKEIHR